jgi:hypothetical protein
VLEKYLPHAGIASVGFFAKDIKDYIYKNVAQQAGGPQKTEGNLGVIDIVGFANASTSHLYGFEAIMYNISATSCREHSQPGHLGELDVGGFLVSGARWTSAASTRSPIQREVYAVTLQFGGSYKF